jgi:hypothetical protein
VPSLTGGGKLNSYDSVESSCAVWWPLVFCCEKNFPEVDYVSGWSVPTPDGREISEDRSYLIQQACHLIGHYRSFGAKNA